MRFLGSKNYGSDFLYPSIQYKELLEMLKNMQWGEALTAIGKKALQEKDVIPFSVDMYAEFLPKLHEIDELTELLNKSYEKIVQYHHH